MCFCWEEESLVILNTVHHPCWQTTFETMDGKQNTHQLKSHFILESFFAALRCVNSPIIFRHEETLRRCHEHHSTCLQADWSEQETKHLPFSEKKILLFTDWHIPTPSKKGLWVIRRLHMWYHRDFLFVFRAERCIYFRMGTLNDRDQRDIFHISSKSCKHIKLQRY